MQVSARCSTRAVPESESGNGAVSGHSVERASCARAKCRSGAAAGQLTVGARRHAKGTGPTDGTSVDARRFG